MAGVSLLPVFKGQKRVGRDLFWEHEGNRAVRSGSWKIVSTFPENRWHLYNLERDPTELKNLSAVNPAEEERLKQLYDKWATENGVFPWEQVIKKKKEL